MNLRSQLISFEGWKNIAYADPLTGWDDPTIGVGHCGPEVCKGLVWTDDLIGKTLDADIAKAEAGIRAALPWFDQLNEPRQAVLVGMAFQMGVRGLLAFKRMLGAARDEHYPQAAGEMLDSAWAKQTPKRARTLAAQMSSGEWQ